ncbi:MAG: hypothetical protein KAX05_15005 [Bacteroidales bacterium]|nr:hypothetical protein [Bacteroidales bacterium]
MFKKKIFLFIITLFLLQVSCEKDDNPNENWQAGKDWIDTRDGKHYKTVRIGNQIWMAENLNYITDSGSWNYFNEECLGEVFGRLYSWETACKSCPEGWHLPTDDEWIELEIYIGIHPKSAHYDGYRGNDEGGKLKEVGFDHWYPPNKGATDEYGFTALPAGCYWEPYFHFLIDRAYFWTSTEDSISQPWTRCLSSSGSDIGRYPDYKESGLSVRCIKD